MKTYTRKITEEQYTRAMSNKGYIADEDMTTVFSASERYGYGVYSPMAFSQGGEFFVRFQMGDSCD